MIDGGGVERLRLDRHADDNTQNGAENQRYTDPRAKEPVRDTALAKFGFGEDFHVRETRRDLPLDAGYIGLRRNLDQKELDAAARIAKVTGSKLSILTVGGNLSGDEMRQLARAEKDIGAALDSISERILIDARKQAEAIGAPDVAQR